ncbi:MAG: hypothetical protein QJT81_07715 [Candidatus Thiothrix putei]|uniref:Transferrin-binding protein B C-lobe/N-lobe beta barrel domain-containing protein n=1 Tax=Candidatus Thiothrix putei TaxID=3080811 RepID=A0AA95HK90_9GAMM|nr:MAG: hypothetical protein QJT81_07715 [Candidatus Thiothrix putei]
MKKISSVNVSNLTLAFWLIAGLSGCGGGTGASLGSSTTSGSTSGGSTSGGSTSGGSTSGGSTSGGTTSTSSPEGLWQGTTNMSQDVTGIVLDNGDYWFLYSIPGNSNAIGGVIQGNATSNAGTITSSNGRDFNITEDMLYDISSLQGTYTAKSTLSGKITYADMPNSMVTFDSTYNADYAKTPTLSALTGTYAGEAATSEGTESAITNISSTGQIIGTAASGCKFTGTATPRSSGNVYNVTVTFNNEICTNNGTQVSGVAYFDSSTQQLYSAALNSTRTDGFLFIGAKE